MTQKSERLTILSEAEQVALYGLPDFDDGQRSDYLSLSESEWVLASHRPSLGAKVYCTLQIGYFKESAKKWGGSSQVVGLGDKLTG